jgi:D-alanyl-lipoteichoic acid acyltransferase DltB (MBOAT superfamily)
MTLGSWLKDYIMYPISRSKGFKQLSKKLKKKWGRFGQKIPYYLAMFVVWTLMGIWHGSSWKYMIGEGWYFWCIIVGSQILEPLFKAVKKALHINDKNPLWGGYSGNKNIPSFCHWQYCISG